MSKAAYTVKCGNCLKQTPLSEQEMKASRFAQRVFYHGDLAGCAFCHTEGKVAITSHLDAQQDAWNSPVYRAERPTWYEAESQQTEPVAQSVLAPV